MNKNSYLAMIMGALLVMFGVCALIYKHNALVSSVSSRHGIVWKSSELSFKLNAADIICPVTFDGFNTGETSLAIEDIKPSCGCVEIETAPREVAAKAPFRISASVHVAPDVTNLFQSIAVQTKDQTDVLGISITRQVYMKIEPRAIIWNDGSTTKNIKLTFWKKQEPSDIILTYDTALLTANLEKTDEDNVFNLSIFKKKNLQTAPSFLLS